MFVALALAMATKRASCFILALCSTSLSCRVASIPSHHTKGRESYAHASTRHLQSLGVIRCLGELQSMSEGIELGPKPPALCLQGGYARFVGLPPQP